MHFNSLEVFFLHKKDIYFVIFLFRYFLYRLIMIFEIFGGTLIIKLNKNYTCGMKKGLNLLNIKKPVDCEYW